MANTPKDGRRIDGGVNTGLKISKLLKWSVSHQLFVNANTTTTPHTAHLFVCHSEEKSVFISFMNETIYIYAVFLPVKNRLSIIIGVHHKISNHVLIDETFFACARFFHLHTASMGSTAFRQFLFLLLGIIELLFASSRQSIIDWFHFFPHCLFRFLHSQQ